MVTPITMTGFGESSKAGPDLLSFLLEPASSSSASSSAAYQYERQRYDGWFNNMAHPQWGSIGTDLM